MMVGNNLKETQLQQIVDKTILLYDKVIRIEILTKTILLYDKVIRIEILIKNA